MPDDTPDEDRDWIDPTTWPAAAAHPEAVRTLTAALTQVLTPYAREHGNAKSFAVLAVESLAVAGRLLPEGGHTRTEWGVGDELGHGAWMPNASRRDSAEYHADRLGRQLVRREVREFDDGSSFTGPWVAVDQPKED